MFKSICPETVTNSPLYMVVQRTFFNIVIGKNNEITGNITCINYNIHFTRYISHNFTAFAHFNVKKYFKRPYIDINSRI